MMNKRRILSVVLSLGLGGGLLYLILRQTNTGTIRGYLKALNLWWILAGILIYTFDTLLRAYKWREILKDNRVFIGIKDSFFAYSLGNTLNIVIPAKVGDAARSYYLKKKCGCGYSKTLPSVFLDRFFDVLGVYVVILASGIFVLSGVAMPRWFYNLMVLGITSLIAVFLVIYYIMNNRSKAQNIKSKKVRELMDTLIDTLEGSIKNRGKFIKLLGYSVLIWLCDGLFTFIIFLAMGQKVSPIAAIFGTMVATLTKVFPVTPGGIGVFEGTMVIIFVLFGFERGLAGVLSTLTHFLMNIYTLSVGMYVLITKEIRVSQIDGEKVK